MKRLKPLQFDIITIFPQIFSSYINESLIARAREKKLIKITTHDLRSFAGDARGTVDDRPFGGGLGMVLKVEPIYKAIRKLKVKGKREKVIVFTPRGQKFNQAMAHKLAKLDRVIFICGRYEGVDERVAEHIADMQVSIGDYDLMGGELPAMVAIEAISRLVPGVLGKEALLQERITKTGGFIEYAQYTRPEIFTAKDKNKKSKTWKVPEVLLSGDHKKITEWKTQHGKVIE